MRNQVLDFIESKNYRLVELHGTTVPVFRLETIGEEPLEFAIVNPYQYQPSRQPTAIEAEMISRVIDEMRRYQELYGEFKFISYDFSLDNTEKA